MPLTMSLCGRFSGLTVCGNDIFCNPLFSELIEDIGKSTVVTYVPNIAFLKERLININDKIPKDQSIISNIEAILLSDFPSSSEIKELYSNDCNIYVFGLPSLYAIHFNNKRWLKTKPIFCFSMENAVISMTGFRDAIFVNFLATLIHWMGGSVRRKLDSSVTHLIAFRCAGEKVRKAALTSANIITIKSSWVEHSWNERISKPFFNACDLEFVNKHRTKVFQACGIFFVGFPPDSTTLTELKALVLEHDGILADDLYDDNLTHVIVADEWSGSSDTTDMSALIVNSPSTTDAFEHTVAPSDADIHFKLNEIAFRVPVLRLDWFWKSLQCTYICHPHDYLYIHDASPPENSFVSPTRTSIDPLSPRVSSATAIYLPSDLPEIEEKENQDPFETFTEGTEHDDSAFLSCLSPWPVDQKPISTKSPTDIIQTAKDNDQKFNQASRREDLLAQLADPLTLRSNRSRYSRGAHSLMLLDQHPNSDPCQRQNLSNNNLNGSNNGLETTATSDVSFKNCRLSNCFSPSMAAAISPNPSLKKIPLEARKSSFDCSPLFCRSSSLTGTGSASKTDEVVGSRTPMHVRLEKRQHRVFELFLTEANYVNILEYLTQTAFLEVIAEDQVGGAIIPRTEANTVFGKLIPIYQLHQRIQTLLTQLQTNWNIDTSRVGELLLPYIDEMDRVYGHYMQFYSAPHLNQLGQDYPRFLAFMRQVERRRESGRQSLSDLLVRPVQRLPSLLLLMQGIMKFTPTSHPDHSDIVQFVDKLSFILKDINVRMKTNEDRISLLTLYHEINGAPPEMLSSSRSLVSRLNVFQLTSNPSSGMPVLEPVTLFLLTDCLEVARPKKRHTGEPLAHAIQAALAAVHGESHEGVAGGSDEAWMKKKKKSEDCAITDPSQFPVDRKSASISRTGSGASNSVTNHPTIFGRSGADSKKRQLFHHLFLLKLQDIKRVIDLETQSLERAAFALIVRGSNELHDHVYTFCLAASFTATAAIASGKCPESVESAVFEATSRRPSVKETKGSPITVIHVKDSSSQPPTDIPPVVGGDYGFVSNPSVATLQHCVNEAKNTFLRRLCHHIVQVSCVTDSPDDLLCSMQPDDVVGIDLESIFSVTNASFKSKKFSRHLGRAISMKTPRRMAAAWTAGHAKLGAVSVDQISNNHQYKATNPPPLPLTTTINDGKRETRSSSLSLRTNSEKHQSLGVEEEQEMESGLSTPSRLSVFGGLLNGFRSHISKTPSTPLQSSSAIMRNSENSSMSQNQDTPTRRLASPCLPSPHNFSLNESICNKKTASSPFLEPAPPQPRNELWICDDHIDYASDDDNGDDDDDDHDTEDEEEEESDLLSLDSYSAAGPWPAFLPQKTTSTSAAVVAVTASTSSLRSTYSMDVHNLKPGATGRTSVSGYGIGGAGTRKSICRSMLDGLRSTMRRPKPTEGSDVRKSCAPPARSCSRTSVTSRTGGGTNLMQAPIAEGEEVSPSLTNHDWFARQKLARLRSVDMRASSGGHKTPSMDKSMSECNLPLRISQHTATSSTASLRHLFSPFRVPSGTCPSMRKSTTVPSATAASHLLLPPTGGDEAHGSRTTLPRWSSLIVLDEEEVSFLGVRNKKKEYNGFSPVQMASETCSMILPPPSLSSEFKRNSLSLLGKLSSKNSKLLKQSKKTGGDARLYGSSILPKPSDFDAAATASSLSNVSSTSRRESYFKRNFFSK